MPEELKPEMPTAKDPKAVEIDGSWLALVSHWRLVTSELSRVHGLLLDDPRVLALPWPGVRTLIFGLLDSDTLLRAALTRR